MDKIQTTVILAIIKTAYPTFGKDVSPEDIVSLWSEMFATDPVELVAAAVKRYIKSGEYPPTVAAISAILADMQAANLPTPAALWTEVDRLMLRMPSRGPRWKQKKQIGRGISKLSARGLITDGGIEL